MGTYNADPNPNLSKIQMVAYTYGFFTQDKTKCDQFSTDSSLKVYHLVRKIGSHRLQLLVDPTLIPA